MTGFSETSDVYEELYPDVEVETEDLVPSSAGSACDKPGRYHVVVNGMSMESEDHEGVPSVARLDLLILDGTEPGQKERTIYHRVRLFKLIWDQMTSDGKKEKGATCVIDREPYSPKYISNAVRAAFALSLTEKGNLRGVDWEQATGRQCIVKVDEIKGSYNDKIQIQHEINWGNFWRVDHEAVKDVPKDGDSLALLTGGAGIAPAGGDDYSDV